MKKYSNFSVEQRSITFEDGVTVFLRRGQSVESDKEVKSMQDGIKVKEVTKSKRRVAGSTTTDSAE